MAADKKTFIRNAQKQVQKGQIDRAITTYKAILKLDPSDVKVHNTLGDLFIRKNQKKEGIKEYLWVANYYEKDGFLLRSIAICQKILNLDQEMVEVRLKLAELYGQQRLAAEAKKQYLLAADHFEKKGKVGEALEAFSKLADLDPGNLQIRIRLGSSYEKQGFPGKAAKEYARAAEGLIKAGSADKAGELIDKALEVSPTNVESRRVKADLHASREEWDAAADTLAPLTEAEDAAVPVLKTYAGACLKTGRAAEAIAALEKAREAEPSSVPLMTLLGRAYIEGKECDKARALYGPTVEELLKAEKFEAAEDLVRQLVDADPSSEESLRLLLDIAERKGDQEGTADSHVKLAELLETKGDREGALASLGKALEIRPEDASAAELSRRLQGDAEEAAPPEPAPAEPEPAAAEREPADEKAEAVAEDAALQDVEEVGLLEEEEILIDEEAVEIALEDEGEELDVDFALDEPAAAAAPAVEPEVEPPREEPEPSGQEPEEEPSSGDSPLETGEDFALEDVEVMDLGEDGGEEDIAAIDLSAVVEGELGDPGGAEAPAEAEAETPGAEMSDADLFSSDEVSELVQEGILDGGVGPELDVETDSEEGVELDTDSLGGIDAVEDSPGTGTAPEGANEELEEFLAEADFYMQQGLTDEAEFLYQKLVKLDPDNTEIAERLERLRSGKPGAGDSPAEEHLIAREEIEALESDLDRVLGGERAPSPTPAPDDSARKLTVADGEGSGDTSEFSDFLSDLKGELEEPEVPEPAPAATDQQSLSEIFQEFQEGLKEQLGEEDFETHYNLGIAYKEMGLMQEALGEFRLAERSQARQLDSISMIALCHKEMGSVNEALGKLEEGLDLAEEGSEEQKGFRYDIGDILFQTGRKEEARDVFRQLFESYPDYRDVAERVQMSQREEGPAEEDAGGGAAAKDQSRVSYL